MNNEIVTCPVCGQNEYISEREIPVMISYNIENSIRMDGVFIPVVRECNFFCSYCKKDF